MEWMLLPLKRYAEFSGRSRRQEYWMFILFTVLGGFVLSLSDKVLGLEIGDEGSASRTGVLSTLFSLATIVPSIAVGVRRLHDTDRSGWWLLSPIPGGIAGAVAGGVIGMAVGSGLGGTMIGGIVGAVVASIALFVFNVSEGDRGANRFGADPKNPEGDLVDVFR